jgi:hypothetical protein
LGSTPEDSLDAVGLGGCRPFTLPREVHRGLIELAVTRVSGPVFRTKRIPFVE